MTLTQRDWENIVRTRCDDIESVKCTLHPNRVHLDVIGPAGTGAHTKIAIAMGALVKDYASDVRVTWILL